MTAQLIDGNATAKAMRESIKERVDARIEQGKRAPGLAVILVGTDPASQVYVSHKRKDCEQVGINSKAFDLPATTSQQELLDLIDQLNNDNDVGLIHEAFQIFCETMACSHCAAFQEQFQPHWAANDIGCANDHGMHAGDILAGAIQQIHDSGRGAWAEQGHALSQAANVEWVETIDVFGWINALKNFVRFEACR